MVNQNSMPDMLSGLNFYKLSLSLPSTRGALKMK